MSWKHTNRVDLLLWLACVVAMVCLLATRAEGQGPIQTHAAIARIRIADPAEGNYYASGSLVDDDGRRGIVLTAWHSFREPSPDSPITATFPDGRAFAAKIIATDSTWDFAALEIGATGLTPLPIAADYATAGDMLTSCGYGNPRESYWCNSGRAVGYSSAGDQTLRQTLLLTGYARDGDSGGPILNSRGELVAVVSFTNGRIVGGTFVGRVRGFLANCRRGRAGGRPCPPGGCPPGQPGPQPWEQSPILPRAPMEPVVPLPGPKAPDPVQIAADPRVDELVTGLAAVDGELGRLATIVAGLDKKTDDLRGDSAITDARATENRRLQIEEIRTELGQLQERVATVGKASSLKLVEGPQGPPGPTGPPVDTTRLDKIETTSRDAVKSLMPWVLGALGLGGVTPVVLAGLALYRLIRHCSPAERAARRRASYPWPTRPPNPPPQRRPEPTPEPQGGAAVAAEPFPQAKRPAPRDDHAAWQRDSSEAAELLRLSQLEGRDPLHDAIVGRFADDELSNTIDRDPDSPESDWARRLRRTLEDRFNAVAPLATVGENSQGA